MLPVRSATLAHRRGAVLVLVIMIMMLLVGFCSLAVDYGHVQSAQLELQRSVDAAAHYGASGLTNGTAVARAIDAANDNLVDGTALDLESGDVELGNWNTTTRVFTAGLSPVNAVRVVGSRTDARGNAVQLLFGSMIGFDSCDIRADAVATIVQTIDYALVGVDSVTMSGTSRVDSYNSNNGPYTTATARNYGGVGSNGNITLTGSPEIRGDAEYGIGKQLTMGNSSVVTGRIAELTQPLVTPAVTLPSTYVNLGVYKATGAVTLTAGTYYSTNFSVPDKATLTLVGDVTVYVNGPVDLVGNVLIADYKPQRFRVRVISNSAVKVGGNGAIIADVYAPQSALTIGGTGDVYGRYVGKSISTGGTGRIHFDEAIPRLIRTSSASLVK